MSVQVILLFDQIKNHEELDKYGELAAASRAGHELSVIALHGRHEILEGPSADGIVVLSFPSLEEAKRWYNSPAYQKALPYRLKAADCRVMIVEVAQPYVDPV